MFLILMGAIMTLYIGDVKVKREGETFNAYIDMELSGGDTILVGKDSKAELMYKDSTTVLLDENTTFSIQEEGEKNRRFFLSLGRVWAKVKKLADWNFEIESPITVAGVRGTEFFVSFTGDSGEVGVIEGTVSVTDRISRKKYMLGSLKKLHFVKNKAELKRLNPDKVKGWATWKRSDIERLLKLAEQGDRSAYRRAELLQNRLKLKGIEKKLERVRERFNEQSGFSEVDLKERIFRLRFQTKELDRRIRGVEPRLDKIESDVQKLRVLIENRRFLAARTFAVELDTEIKVLRPMVRDIERRCHAIEKQKGELMHYMKEEGNRVSEVTRASAEFEKCRKRTRRIIIRFRRAILVLEKLKKSMKN